VRGFLIVSRKMVLLHPTSTQNFRYPEARCSKGIL
jgi:hypothetical protein